MQRNLERVALLAAAVAAIVVVGLSFRFERCMSNQKALFYQLQAIRTAVNLYKAINKTGPRGLIDLQEEYRFPGEEESRRYLESTPIDREGNMMDPFGNRYQYDEASSWVRSTTPGYEFW